MSPDRLREYVLIFTRDFFPPALGGFGFIYLLVTKQFEPWHLPLIAGLCGVPLVAPRGHGDGGKPPPEELPP